MRNLLAFLRGGLPITLAICLTTSVILALTPRERQIVQHANAQIDEAIAHDAERTKAVAEAKSEAAKAYGVAALASESAQTAGERAKEAEAKEQAQHDELVRCATENAKMREIVDAVSGPWWFPGLNALVYAIKKSVLSLFVIIAIVVVIGVCLKFFAPGVLTALGLAGNAVKRFGVAAINFIKRYLPKSKPKP